MQARRISLFFSSAMALTGAAAVAFSPLPRAYGVLIVLAAATGLFWDLREGHFIPRTILTLLGLAGFLVTIMPLRRETLAEQSLAALTILLAVKLLERKARRDHLQILALSAVITVGAGSLAPELAFGTLILLVCVIGTFYLLWLPFADVWNPAGGERGLLLRLSGIAATMILLALPLALVLFVVLPRSVSPFWGGFGLNQRKVSGFSEEIRLGEVGRLAVSQDTAFRAEMLNHPGPFPEIPYWRGAIMEETDGRNWTSLPEAASVRVAPAPGDVQITYYVEPHGEYQLFLLEQPSAAYFGFRSWPLTESGALRRRTPLYKRVRYRGFSQPSPYRPGVMKEADLERNLQLPPGLSPRITNLAAGLTEGASSPEEVAERVLSFFGTGFTYTLDVPPSTGDPLVEFLFRHRSGYCEYFASALAVMLRAGGVPARLVAGYLGGEYNANGNYYLVKQAAAHTWVEAWLGERGWVRLDSTPAAGELGGTFASRSAPKTRLWLDSFRMKWNSWVVQYDAEVQIGLVRKGARGLFRLRLSPPSLKDTARRLAWLLLPGALGLLWLLRGRERPDPLSDRYKRFCRIAAGKGVARPIHEGPVDYGRRVAAAWPEAGRKASEFTGLYAELHYGGRAAGPGELSRLDSIIRELRRGT